MWLKRAGCGFDPHCRGNELLFLNILISSLWHQGKSLALSSATQQAIPRKTRRQLGNGVSYHYVPAAYSTMCGVIQREADLI